MSASTSQSLSMMAEPRKLGEDLRRVASVDSMVTSCSGDLGCFPEDIDDAEEGETAFVLAGLDEPDDRHVGFGARGGPRSAGNAGDHDALMRAASAVSSGPSRFRRVTSASSMATCCSGDLDSAPEDFHDGGAAQVSAHFVLRGLDRQEPDGDSEGDSSCGRARRSTLIRVESADSVGSAGSTSPASSDSGGAGARSLSKKGGLSGGASSSASTADAADATARGGWLASLSPKRRPKRSTPTLPSSLEHSPLSVLSGWSVGLKPLDQVAKCMRDLGVLLRSPSVTKVVVLMGAGASVESRLETYANMEKHYFSVGADNKIVAHSAKPIGVPAFTYGQLFGPLHSWQDADELSYGVSKARFHAFKRVSDAFCREMVDKFSQAQPHQGYLDLVSALERWRAGALSSEPGERRVMVATTNLDKLGAKAFEGLARVHEMHGDINLTRQHKLPLRAPRRQGSNQPEHGVLTKPLVMHFEEDYYRPVRCRRARGSIGSRGLCEEGESFTFRHMKPEVKEFVPPATQNGQIDTVVLEIGCSHRVRAVPALREALLKRGAVVFVVNPCEQSSRVKQRTLASQPMLMSKLHNLRVAPAGFGEFSSGLKAELLGAREEPHHFVRG